MTNTQYSQLVILVQRKAEIGLASACAWVGEVNHLPYADAKAVLSWKAGRIRN